MIHSVLSIIFAAVAAFGRQASVLTHFRPGLWFFSSFERKRAVLTGLSVLSGTVGFLRTPKNSIFRKIPLLSVPLLMASHLFDFRYIFPEISRTVKKRGKDIGVKSNRKVVGVCIDGVAVAYPLEDIVIPRHIINDDVNGKGVLVTYCAMCRSALVFSSEVDGEKLYFRVAGVWRRNMIMVDDTTQSIWQQATGECIYGKYKGRKLELLSGENTVWSAWSRRNPESLFVTEATEARFTIIPRKLMLLGIYLVTPKVTMPGLSDLSGLPPRETVFGIKFNGIARAYPVSELKSITEFTDKFGERKVKLSYNSRPLAYLKQIV
jgi:hypothetical protein